MRIEPCPACGKPIDVDDECRHLPDPPGRVIVGEELTPAQFAQLRERWTGAFSDAP